MRNIELLSPARDADTGIAAVNCGADAVYIGAGKYGARKDAANEINEIERLIKYAHLFRSKVYLALNTILNNDEIEDAVGIIHKVWNAGIDGLIIQDLGLLNCNLPPIPLIASTQTDNRTAEKVKFLENCGFTRVILARELNLDEIRHIHATSKIELESFVHGALCVSYSGQCWASVAVTGRSANRGECAQICRSSFDLEDAEGRKVIKNKHLLSLKDLNLSTYIKHMIDAGISSFKIEGRLKDINYVKNITAYYRLRIDNVLECDKELRKSSAGISYFSFIPDPDKTFNRGYTSHFIEGRQPDLSSFFTQKSLGKMAGKFLSASNGILFFELSEEIHNGDGLCFFDHSGQLTGFQVNKADKNRITSNSPVDIPAGASIYRNLDIQFQRDLDTKTAERKIIASASFEESENGFLLRIEDEDGYVAQNTLEGHFEIAKNPELAENAVNQQIAKAGDTIFRIEKTNINWSKPYFIPVSKINALRRDVLALLLTSRIEGYKRNEIVRIDFKKNYPGESLDYKANVLNNKSEEFYLEHGVNSIEPAFESGLPKGNPLIMKTRYCIKFELGICPNKQGQQSPSEFKEPYFLRDANRRYRLEFDCKACEMNLYIDERPDQH